MCSNKHLFDNKHRHFILFCQQINVHVDFSAMERPEEFWCCDSNAVENAFSTKRYTLLKKIEQEALICCDFTFLKV